MVTPGLLLDEKKKTSAKLLDVLNMKKTLNLLPLSSDHHLGKKDTLNLYCQTFVKYRGNSGYISISIKPFGVTVYNKISGFQSCVSSNGKRKREWTDWVLLYSLLEHKAGIQSNSEVFPPLPPPKGSSCHHQLQQALTASQREFPLAKQMDCCSLWNFRQVCIWDHLHASGAQMMGLFGGRGLPSLSS